MSANNLLSAFMSLNYNLWNEVIAYRAIDENTLIIGLDNGIGLKVRFNTIAERFDILRVEEYSELVINEMN